MSAPPSSRTNPFRVTKAVDFTDTEIIENWVDLPGDGFESIASPISPMPLLLLGGKGGGRTHLMRYFSASSQSLRREGRSVLEQFKSDGYIGVYIRCSGLNSGRFAGKGQDLEAWSDVFCYYTDLWIAQHTIRVVLESLSEELDFDGFDNLTPALASLFDIPPEGDLRTLGGLLDAIHQLQRNVDIAVNNAALTRELDVQVRATRGQLVFGVPERLASEVPALGGLQFTYLLDELENLTEAQQRYVNTLIREKEAPSGFIVGSRLYGLRTVSTFASEEENKEGSEYESVYLDRIYLRESKKYEGFCRRMVSRRLAEAGFLSPEAKEAEAQDLDRFFVTHDSDQLGLAETQFIFRSDETERRCIATLRRQLEEGMARRRARGIEAPDHIDEALGMLALPEAPLIEKLNCFLFYQDWYRQGDLREAAEKIGERAAAYVSGEPSDRHETQLKLFRSDLLAQLLRTYGQKQRYVGIETFVRMSSGLPRNLVIILKNIYRWATFDGEVPFGDVPISEAAQREGVLQASNWFREDCPGVGEQGRLALAAVDRLARLFRVMRYADKPTESSLVTFSVDEDAVSPRARATITDAQQWSMLIPVEGGQRDRNTGAVVSKYQLSRMLAPRWDLPIARRGAIGLTGQEANAIFDPAFEAEYEPVLRTRLSRLSAPFFGMRDEENPSLFEA